MDAVVLAGGEGARLRPLTRYRPKPMLPVANRPIVEYVLDALDAAGVEHVVVVTGHRGDRLQNHLSNRYHGLDLDYVTQRNQLGSGHALLQAAGTVSDPFVVVNGDNVIDAELVRSAVSRFEHGDGIASAAVAPSPTPEEYGAVLTSDGRMTAVIEGPSEAVSYRINAGVYVCTSAIFDVLGDLAPTGDDLLVTDALVDLPGDVLVANSSGTWLDPSDHWNVLAVTESLLLARPDLVAYDGAFEDGVLIDRTARVHDSAIVEGPAVVGPDCEIHAGALVRRSTCLGPNTCVGPNAVVERSVVVSDASVGGSALLRDCVVGDGVDVGDGVTAPGGPADILVNGRLYQNKRLGAVMGDRATVGANTTITPGARIAPSVSVAPGTTVEGRIEDSAEVVS